MTHKTLDGKIRDIVYRNDNDEETSEWAIDQLKSLFSQMLDELRMEKEIVASADPLFLEYINGVSAAVDELNMKIDTLKEELK